MNPRLAPDGPTKGSTGHGQSGNSGGQGLSLEPSSSNADIRFKSAPGRGQE
ncbi:hypothetical protein CP98_01191 [Sphingobium yanoikuyae]|jgi:hypothetical protein|uniref:Uncharacterized protein n=1 Tax=Sphingobium yanoikuyae TaxID=13690 RepID=A0A084ER75_SPHYA|nr:hypothetical protein CP98_01191 [Sphingobium yanoikuyae]